MWIGQAQRATASGERIFQVMDEPEEVKDAEGRRRVPAGPRPRPLPGRVLRRRRGTARAGGDRAAESRRDWTIALIGHTGSGKTTLASLVPRFYDATEGRVTIDGADVRDVPSRALAARSASSPRIRSCSRNGPREYRLRPTRATPREIERQRARPRRRVHRPAPRWLRPSSASAGSAFGRAAPADRDRPRAARDPRILILDDAPRRWTRRPRHTSGSACARS